MDVFYDQKFLLQRPTGERCTRSFFEIMTGPDEPLSFAYPVEYMNVAALELCAALAQATLEPDTYADLAERLHTPMSTEECSTLIAPYRDDFSIDGPMRFMQGTAPDAPASPSPESMTDVLLTVRKGGSAFLNRPHEHWAVQMDQIPLFLFSRATFTEKQGGRGYLAGTSRDMEIRTCLTDTTSLRRSIWLNVLCREAQEYYHGAYPLAGTPDVYDTWLWKTLPGTRTLPQHSVTLRAALFWTVARHVVTLAETTGPTVCAVTGAVIPAGERAGVAIDKSSVGVGYSTDRNEDDASGAPTFFFHPNAPYEMVQPRDGGQPYPRHFTVDEHAKLVEMMRGLFFADNSGILYPAPALRQLTSMSYLLPEYGGGVASRLQLLCFGFHMLTAQKSVHGGYEVQTFSYPLVGTGDPDPEEAQHQAFFIISASARRAQEILDILSHAVRLCTMTGVETTVAANPGKPARVTMAPKARERLTAYDAHMRDLTVAYWAYLGGKLQQLLLGIHLHGSTHEELAAHSEDLQKQWYQGALRRAADLFTRVFDDYATLPGSLLAAHNARRYFLNALRKKGYSLASSTPILQSTEDMP